MPDSNLERIQRQNRRAFESVICAYQEQTAASGAISAAEYGREAGAGKATHTGSGCIVKPGGSDFLCDVEICARRSLNSGELAYFNTFYKTCDLVVEPGNTECLQQHIESFPDKYRAAVASLDSKVRLKLGARLLEAGISPVSAYMSAEDVRGRKLKTTGKVISIDACAESFGFDISACAAESDPAKFLTADEASVYLGGLNSRTVTRWAREGYLPAIPIGEGKRRLWRFLQSDLEEWMLARRQGGQNAA